MKRALTILLLLIPFMSLLSQPNDRVAKTPKLNYDWRPGLVSITELTYATGLSETEKIFANYYYGITTVTGYQFTRNIKAGIGIGIHKHNGGTLFPLFLDARYSFSAQELVPFIAAAGGLALNLEDLNSWTFVFVNPSVGIKWVVANRTGVSFSTGLMVMSATENRNSYINFKLGLEMKGK